jgi:5,10-methylenetetrahydromethanopterin reductase
MIMRKELWYLGLPKAKASVKRAKFLEAHGWDGLMFPDTQCIAHDVYIEMAMCVTATTKLKFSTGVTNPITRDCSVVASMLATLQEESNGRMRVGIGRGDSAAAHIGKKGASLKEMREFLTNLQGYLGGKSVTRDEAQSRLLWLDSNQAEKVPVDIAGTGPKMIEMAALLGDGICLAVGGNTQRISAKVKMVEEILDRVGRPRDDFTISLLISGTVNYNAQIARDNIRGATGVMSRFSGMSAAAAADLPEEDRDIVMRIAREYRVQDHGLQHSLHARNMPNDFLDRETISGPPDLALERLEEIYSLGVDRVWLTCASFDSEPEIVEESISLISTEVLPKLRMGADK